MQKGIYFTIKEVMMKEDKIEIKFDLEKVTNNFLLHLKKITENVTLIYHSIDNVKNKSLKPLPTDDLPIIINDNKQSSSINEQKEQSLNWIMTKAFEEFINGLTKSLKEAYKYLRIYKLSTIPKYTLSKEELETEFKNIDAEVEKIHFPDFLNKIEKLLEKELPLKEEILSINKIRNCLVHRNGVVGEKDIKYSSSNTLLLKWNSLKSWAKQNGKQVEITYDLRKNGIITDGFSIQQIKNRKKFEINEQISINLNEFNGISYTCTEFANNLFPLMPRPIEDKAKSA